MKKFGGVQNAVAIDEVQEAECIILPQTPPITIGQFLCYLPMAIIKLLPITLLLMAIMWGVSLLIVGF